MLILQKISGIFASIASIDKTSSNINYLRQRAAAQSLEMPGEKGSRKRAEEGGNGKGQKKVKL